MSVMEPKRVDGVREAIDKNEKEKRVKLAVGPGRNDDDEVEMMVDGDLMEGAGNERGRGTSEASESNGKARERGQE